MSMYNDVRGIQFGDVIVTVTKTKPKKSHFH